MGHFQGLKEAKPDLVGIAIYDRLSTIPVTASGLTHTAWQRRELENYLCHEETLLAWAEAQGRNQAGDLFALAWRDKMLEAIQHIRGALADLGKPDAWSPDLKSSDEFLDPLFKRFFTALGLPNLMRKTDYHTLAPFVPSKELDDEVREKLDAIVEVALLAKPRGSTD